MSQWVKVLVTKSDGLNSGPTSVQRVILTHVCMVTYTHTHTHRESVFEEKKSKQECVKLHPHKAKTGLQLNLPCSSTNNVKGK